jgi:hypothetical protein
MSRAYTDEEVRHQFLSQIKSYVDYWATVEGKTSIERCNGLAFSILIIFDGGSSSPAFDITVHPHPSDREFHEAEGENWYEPVIINNSALLLHEEFIKWKSKSQIKTSS